MEPIQTPGVSRTAIAARVLTPAHLPGRNAPRPTKRIRTLLTASLVAAAALLGLRAPALAAPNDPLQVWTARYNGPTSDFDQARAVAVSGAGDVFVTGFSLGGSSNSDYATVKYDGATGQQLWVARYDGPGSGDDEAKAVAVDADGDVFVTGLSYGSLATSYDYATVKYDGATGQQLWVARYNGPGNNTDIARAVVVDGAGNVCVTGNSFGGYAFSYDYGTVKYSGATGAVLWTGLTGGAARYNGPFNSEDVAQGLALDGAGNICVTGYSHGGGTSYDYATVKYDGATGQQLWLTRYNGPANAEDLASAPVVDGAGNVIVTGYSVGSFGASYDFATVKYDGATGQQVWVARHNGPNNSYDVARALAVDAAGNVCVTGFSGGGSAGEDYATVKYDGTTGQQLWVVGYNGPGNWDDEAQVLALDLAGDAYVTGFSYGVSTSFDFATVKYDGATGQQVWAARFTGPGSNGDSAQGLAVDGSGSVYVTGYSYEGSGPDYATIKYSQIQAPAADAGPNQTVEATGTLTSVTLDGSGSSDPHGASLSYVWKEGASQLATGVQPSVSLAIGVHDITLTVTNSHNLSATDTVRITVQYSWSGVLQPIHPDGSSIFKLGRTVPVKFSLTGASAGIANLVARLFLAKVSSGIAGSEFEATSTAAANSGNTFRYDAASGQYLFNLETKSLSEGTWQLRIDLGDGALNTVLISLKN